MTYNSSQLGGVPARMHISAWALMSVQKEGLTGRIGLPPCTPRANPPAMALGWARRCFGRWHSRASMTPSSIFPCVAATPLYGTHAQN
jgi:hypothetical protein